MVGNEQEPQGKRALTFETRSPGGTHIRDSQSGSFTVAGQPGLFAIVKLPSRDFGCGTEPVNTYRHRVIVYNVRHK